MTSQPVTPAPPFSGRRDGMLSLSDVAQALGVSKQTIIQQKQSGQLIALRFDQEKRYSYPDFQVNPALAGSVLATIVAALGTECPALRYAFFLGEHDLLGYLTPVELLLGAVSPRRTMDPLPHATGYLALPFAERLAAVVRVAETYVPHQ